VARLGATQGKLRPDPIALDHLTENALIASGGIGRDAGRFLTPSILSGKNRSIRCRIGSAFATQIPVPTVTLLIYFVCNYPA
jgi:hypothetical protein